MINARIELKPLSVNQAWKGVRYKTDKYKSYERSVMFLLPKRKIESKGMLRVELFFGFSSKASDIDNPVKMTLDILQKKFGFDDKQIFELNVRKCIVKKGKEFTEISISNLLPI